ncbi:hypothetical protein AaE_012260 [Aphanomyces astaci]|uniref:DUF7769 domain-containing protein n=1 Tax=Aphanomyces astaci TaxID=112090 RepID=A0A6A4ZH21_APHAT|nr:hypothetical protein AaE_012260 [Aphanomyces astaci]
MTRWKLTTPFEPNYIVHLRFYHRFMPTESVGAHSGASCASHSPRKLNKHMTLDERRGVYEMLLGAAVNGDIPLGVLTKTAQRFGCHPRTISRLWRRAKLSVHGDGGTADVSTKMCKKTSET